MAWLTNWLYRKSILVANAGAALTNYQLNILVGESSGATGENIDCRAHVASDFDDLRFTTSDGTTLCDYWIESLSGSSPNTLASIWVEIPSLAASGNTTLYVYYGGTQTAVSNGTATFVAFDNFERGSNGDAVGGIWTVGAGSVILSTEQAYDGSKSMKVVGNGYAGAYCSLPASGYAIMMRMNKETLCTYSTWVSWGDGSKRVYSMIDSAENVLYYDTGFKDTTKNITAGTWQLLEIRNPDFSAGTYDIWVNGSAAKTGAAMQSAGSSNGTYGIECDVAEVAGRDSYYDQFIVRNFRSTDTPTWGSVGVQEISPSSLKPRLGIKSAAIKKLKGIKRINRPKLGGVSPYIRNTTVGKAVTSIVGELPPLLRSVGTNRGVTLLLGSTSVNYLAKTFNKILSILSGVVLTIANVFTHQGGVAYVEELSSLLGSIPTIIRNISLFKNIPVSIGSNIIQAKLLELTRIVVAELNIINILARVITNALILITGLLEEINLMRPFSILKSFSSSLLGLVVKDQNITLSKTLKVLLGAVPLTFKDIASNTLKTTLGYTQQVLRALTMQRSNLSTLDLAINIVKLASINKLLLSNIALLSTRFRGFTKLLISRERIIIYNPETTFTDILEGIQVILGKLNNFYRTKVVSINTDLVREKVYSAFKNNILEITEILTFQRLFAANRQSILDISLSILFYRLLTSFRALLSPTGISSLFNGALTYARTIFSTVGLISPLSRLTSILRIFITSTGTASFVEKVKTRYTELLATLGEAVVWFRSPIPYIRRVLTSVALGIRFNDLFSYLYTFVTRLIYSLALTKGSERYLWAYSGFMASVIKVTGYWRLFLNNTSFNIINYTSTINKEVLITAGSLSILLLKRIAVVRIIQPILDFDIILNRFFTMARVIATEMAISPILTKIMNILRSYTSELTLTQLLYKAFNIWRVQLTSVGLLPVITRLLTKVMHAALGFNVYKHKSITRIIKITNGLLAKSPLWYHFEAAGRKTIKFFLDTKTVKIFKVFYKDTRGSL